MGVELLLSRLLRVRQTGPDRWIASSPTREDEHPSVSIRVLKNGMIVMHDFGGDSTESILAAIGLNFTALFPENQARGLLNHHKAERRPFNPADILACLAFEAAVVLQCANTVRAGSALNAEDHARLVTACGRLVGGMDVAHGE